MFTKKEWIIFAAGAEAFHTVSHMVINYTGTLPVYVFNMEWTQQLNYGAIILNAIITVALIKWAASLKK